MHRARRTETYFHIKAKFPLVVWSDAYQHQVAITKSILHEELVMNMQRVTRNAVIRKC